MFPKNPSGRNELGDSSKKTSKKMAMWHYKEVSEKMTSINAKPNWKKSRKEKFLSLIWKNKIEKNLTEKMSYKRQNKYPTKTTKIFHNFSSPICSYFSGINLFVRRFFQQHLFIWKLRLRITEMQNARLFPV